MQDNRKLKVWQRAHKLALNTFGTSAYFKAPEAWSLRDQTLRAAISIPSNIAEGCGRGSDPTFGDSSGIRWDLVMNLSMIFNSRGRSDFCLPIGTTD